MKLTKKNELEKRAEYNRKHNKGLGWFVSLGEGKEQDDKLELATPYMLRNDGKVFNVAPIHPYIKYIQENTNKALNKLATTRFNSLEWFYSNTNSSDTKQLIKIIIKYLINHYALDYNDNIDLTGVRLIVPEEVENYLDELNANTNQEFCRVRTSGLLFSGTSNEIYFRISSIRFNWFDLIWSFVYKNRNFISNITVCKDANTFGGRFDIQEFKNIKIDHLPINEFLKLL